MKFYFEALSSEDIEDIVLDYLYSLTIKEYEEETLTEHENKGYVTIVDFCHENDIVIHFGIEL